MAILNFALSSDAVYRVRDILICLSRFNETVDVEASPDGVRLSPVTLSSWTDNNLANSIRLE
jgi:cell cycle checkpoint control protein RAD9A